MNTQLLCLFADKSNVDIAVDYILNNYKFTNPNIFILESKIKPEDIYITFNVEKGSIAIQSDWKTILVHRKKHSNTIYTINALNELIKSKTGGQIDSQFAVEWDEYRNCILTTAQSGYKKSPTKIYKTIYLNNFEM
jgi:hypothetical protein